MLNETDVLMDHVVRELVRLQCQVETLQQTIVELLPVEVQEIPAIEILDHTTIAIVNRGQQGHDVYVCGEFGILTTEKQGGSKQKRAARQHRQCSYTCDDRARMQRISDRAHYPENS